MYIKRTNIPLRILAAKGGSGFSMSLIVISFWLNVVDPLFINGPKPIFRSSRILCRHDPSPAILASDADGSRMDSYFAGEDHCVADSQDHSLF
jgi:hypothetical protein